LPPCWTLQDTDSLEYLAHVPISDLDCLLTKPFGLPLHCILCMCVCLQDPQQYNSADMARQIDGTIRQVISLSAQVQVGAGGRSSTHMGATS